MKLIQLLILLVLYCKNLSIPMIPDNAPKIHHTKNGFQNADTSIQSKGLGAVLSWKLGNLFKKLPSTEAKDYPIETLPNDGSAVRANLTKLSFTWIGHATVLLQIDGKNILTDPIWSERCSPISFIGPKRFTNPGIKLENLPRIDLIVISHNHYDHLDLPTLKALDNRDKPTIFVGLKNKDFLKGEGLTNVIELDWWDVRIEKDIRITFTPTQHFSGRGLFDREETLWGSYVIEGKKETIYFAGDTGYFAGFKEIGNKFPKIDVAILPIGAYEPRWFMKPIHMNPEDTLQAFQDLGAKYLLPMHYLTFVLTDEPLDEPLKITKSLIESKKIKKDSLLDLKIGETKIF
jgi:N-acyl-phosphatidylethanolamine-hydrolysing phospholipase D